VVLIAPPGECLGRRDAQLASEMGQRRRCRLWQPSVGFSSDSRRTAALRRTGALGPRAKASESVFSPVDNGDNLRLSSN
jgi:hypothetical protein